MFKIRVNGIQETTEDPLQVKYAMNYKYDLAISFAGEQRGLADTLACRLDATGFSVFYDEFEQAKLWGDDLSVTLEKVYSRETRYCLIILSSAYLEKPWTEHERRSAIGEFIKRRSGFILCLKIEDVELPLADYICPSAGTVDEGIAREAFVEMIIELTTLGVTDMDALTGRPDADGIRAVRNSCHRSAPV